MTTAKIKVHAIYTDFTVHDQEVKQMLADTNSIYLSNNPSVSFELSSSEQIFDSALIQEEPTGGVGVNFHLARESRAVRYPGKLVVIFRSNPPYGSHGSSWADYLVMTGVSGLDFAHEVGHYLHLGHTHNDTALGDLDAANRDHGIAAAKSLAIDMIRISGGLGVFDGDAGDPDAPEVGFAMVGDTPPDPGPALFQPTYYDKDGKESANAIVDEECSGTLSLVVDGKTFLLAPERTNVMSYFKHCKNVTHTVSPHQRRVIERALTGGNRRHLTSGVSPEAPAAVVTPDGFIHVFARADDQNIWHNYWNGKIWSGWRDGDLGGGTLISGPTAVVTKDGAIHVFAQGLDRTTWHSFWNGQVWSGWIGGEMGPGTQTSAPTAVVTPDGFLHVFARGDDRNISHNFWNGKAWSGWKGGQLGAGTLTSGPTAVVTTDGAIHVFARGDDRNVWHSFGKGQVWSGWKGGELGAGKLTSGPTAVLTTDGFLHVFARGDDRNIWHSFWNGKVWNGWHADLSGGTFMSGLATVVSSDKALHAFAQGDDRSIFHSFLVGKTWSGWGSELGGGTFQP